MRAKELAILLQVPAGKREELHKVLDMLLEEGKITINKRGRYEAVRTLPEDQEKRRKDRQKQENKKEKKEKKEGKKPEEERPVSYRDFHRTSKRIWLCGTV